MRRCFFLAVVVLLAGCGGQSGGGGTAVSRSGGQASLTITWPTRPSTRLIPVSSNSITVTLTQGTTFAVKTVTRPASGTSTAAMVSNLPYGDFAVTVKAFASKDGTGVAQAEGAGTITVAKGAPATVNVAMDSTVKHLAITGIPSPFLSGQTARLALSATDESGDLVPLSAGEAGDKVVWTSDTPGVASVETGTPSPLLTAVLDGTAHLTATLKVTDAGDVVSTTTPLAVGDPTRIASPVAVGNIEIYRRYVKGAVVQSADYLGSLLKDLNSKSGSTDPKTHAFTGEIRYAKGLAEFNVPASPPGMTLSSVTLNIDVVLGFAVSHSVWVYRGDGTITSTDGSASGETVGSFGATVGTKTLDLSIQAKNLIRSGATLIGVGISTPLDTATGGRSGQFENAKLVFTYVPNS